MNETLGAVADLLLDIEAEMRRSGLWSDSPPPDEAFASQLPFCVDTMQFTEWVQFVFLVRLRHVVTSGVGLPAASNIAPMAEEAFAAAGIHSPAVLVLMRRFDQLISGASLSQD